MTQLRVGLVQQRSDPDRQRSLDLSATGIRQAAGKGADLVVLPELHAGPYPCQTENPALFDRAEPIPGPGTDFFGKLAKDLNIVLVASLFERRTAGLYHNTAVVLERTGEIAGIYRKMHIPDDPGYFEKFYFTPGDLGFSPIDTSAGRLGVLICWDQWYPEAARLMALAGAEILVYPTAIGWDPGDEEEERQRQLDAWMTVQRAHAIANGLPVAAVNRVGWEPVSSGATQGADFWGYSFVAGPQGEILTAAEADEEVLIARVDRRRCEQVRRIWPFLRDRRIDAYEDILKRYRD